MVTKKSSKKVAKVLAYHFVNKTLLDGRAIPANGEWPEHDGEIVMCKSGLHASLHPFDALQYAPGNTLCLVEIEGDIQEQADKVVCRRRKIIKIIKIIDAEPMLRESLSAAASAAQKEHLANMVAAEFEKALP